MPSEIGPESSAGSVRIAVAPVIDFHFGLFLLGRYCATPEKWVPPWVDSVSDENPALIREFASFWAERGLADVEPGQPYPEWGELLVAAWRTGSLFSPSVGAMLDRLEVVLGESHETPELLSEPREVSDLIDRRLDLLRTNPGDREAYAGLVRRLWSVMEPVWERGGRSDAARLAADLSARARTENDVRSLVPGNNFLHKDAFQSQIAAAQARGELVIVPLGMGGAGQLFWSFPDLVLIGAGLDNAEREAKRRERAERAAGRLKVLSDPTRVAILLELLRPMHHAATVTELASRFGLSQPTVSVHIKMLREAGLVQSEREGNQVHYQAESAVVRDYVDDALTEIVGGESAGESNAGQETTGRVKVR